MLANSLQRWASNKPSLVQYDFKIHTWSLPVILITSNHEPAASHITQYQY